MEYTTDQLLHLLEEDEVTVVLTAALLARSRRLVEDVLDAEAFTGDDADARGNRGRMRLALLELTRDVVEDIPRLPAVSTVRLANGDLQTVTVTLPADDHDPGWLDAEEEVEEGAEETDRVTFQLEPHRARRLLEVLTSAAAHPSGLGSYEAATDAQELCEDLRLMMGVKE